MVVSMENIPHRHLSTWSPVGGAVCGDYRILSKWSLTGGGSLGWTLEFTASPHFADENVIRQLTASVTQNKLLPYVAFSHGTFITAAAK